MKSTAKENMLKLKYGDKLLIDPGYIEGVYEGWGDTLEPRFDGLKCEQTLHSGDDGLYTIAAKRVDNKSREIIANLGVDSGRIWLLSAEFDIYVDVDAGLSGYKIIEAEDVANYTNFECFMAD